MFSWYSDIFFGTKFKKIDLTCGWLEVDLGSRLARVTPQLEMYTLAFGHFSLIFLATPVMVPPVPAPRTTMSTLPENKAWTNTFSAKWLKISFFCYCFKNDTKFLAFDRNSIKLFFSPWGLLKYKFDCILGWENILNWHPAPPSHCATISSPVPS